MDRRQAVETCLAAIVEKTRTPYELLVVDNGSQDGTVGWLEAMDPRGINACAGYRVFPMGDNRGVCARNVALRASAGAYVLQVDDDVVVGPGWDEALLAPMVRDPAVGAVGQQGFWLNWVGLQHPGRTLFLDDRHPEAGDFCDLVMGYCWAWRNDGAAGAPRFLYDERFKPHWHEETDIQLQIKAAGYRIRCGPVVAAHHSMKSWERAHGNDPIVGLQHAVAHERLLLEKWGGRRQDLGLELDRRGLQ